MTGKKFTTRSLLKQYTENATTHGISAIKNSEWRITKLAFAIILLALFVSMSYSVYKMIDSFFDYKTVTNVSLKSRREIEFPSVSICRNNRISRLYLPDSYVKLLEDMVERIKSNASYEDHHDLTDNLTLKLRAAMENNNRTVLKEPPMILKHFKDTCLFGKTQHCNISRDFVATYNLTNNGRCYTFNPGEVHKYVQKGSGPSYGLSLILYVNQSDYVPLADNSDGAGFTIYIHRPTTKPFIQVDGILVAPGQVTNVELSKRKVILKSKPYGSNCSDHVVQNYFPGEYSLLSCKLSCVLHKVMEKCDYVDPLIRGFIHDAKFTNSTVDKIRCRDGIADPTVPVRHQCNCPLPCVSEHFSSSVSTSKWPANADMEAYKYMLASSIPYDPKNTTDDFVRDNFAKVKVYFGKLILEELEETEMESPYDLVSNIGGQLGFWTGSSIFSIAEVLALIMGFIILIINKTFHGEAIIKDDIKSSTSMETRVDENVFSAYPSKD